MLNLMKTYGPVFSIKLASKQPAVVLADTDIIREIALAPADVVQTGVNLPLRPLVGPASLLSLGGETHVRARRMIGGAFRAQHLDSHVEITRRVAAEQSERWSADQQVRSRPLMLKLFGTAISEMLWGFDHAEEAERIFAASEEGLKLAADPAFGILMIAGDPNAPAVKRVMATRTASLHSEIRRLIVMLKRDPRGLEGRKDFMSTLICARDKDGVGFTEDELVDHAMTLTAAGHETSSTATSWLFDILAHRPELQELLADGADDKVGSSELYKATIYETLRVRPVVPATLVVAKQEMQVGDWMVQKNAGLLTHAFLTHMNPEHWTNPSEFDIGRWESRKPGGYDWVPFGAGPHRCVGSQLAVMQIEAVTREVLLRYRIEAVGPPEGGTTKLVTRCPANDGPLRFVRR